MLIFNILGIFHNFILQKYKKERVSRQGLYEIIYFGNKIICLFSKLYTMPNHSISTFS